MRKKYYHAATPETMEKIIADGVVKRGWDGCVYLCEKPQDAAKFVAIRGHDEVAVIEVILPANKVKESFDHSVQFFQCKALLWSSIFVTLMANKIGGLQFGIYRNCQISSRVFHTAVAALPLTKANRSDFE